MLALSVLTWNVWFETFQLGVRARALLRISELLSPEVICLQEVTSKFIRVLRDSSILENYTCSDDLSGSSIEPYGVLTLTKKSLNATYRWVELPTTMERKLLLAEFKIQAEPMLVGNVHLESLNNHYLREAQLLVCAKQLQAAPFALLCGDFNFCSYRNFNPVTLPLENDSLKSILPGAKDLWLALNDPSVDPGYTFDGPANPMVTHPDERMRYDRILYLSGNSHWQPVSINILGNSPLEVHAGSTDSGSPVRTKAMTSLLGRNVVQVYPSDHFGLIGRFSLPATA